MAFTLREVGHTAEVVFHSLSGEYLITKCEKKFVYQKFRIYLDAFHFTTNFKAKNTIRLK